MSERILTPYRKAIVNLVAKQVMGYLLTVAPWLGLPVVYFIFDKVVYKAVEVILDVTVLGLNMTYIVAETSLDYHRFKKLLEIYKEKEKELTQNELEELEKQIIETGFDLIDLNLKRL